MMTDITKKDSGDKEMTLVELISLIQNWIRYFLSKWYIFLIIGLIGGSIGYFYANSKEPVYTATTTFVLETGEQAGGLGQMTGLAALAGLDISGGNNGLFQGDNLFALYKSRAMLERVLLSPNPLDTTELLINQYIRFNKLDLENKKANQPAVDFKKDTKTLDPSTLRRRDSLLGVFTRKIVDNNLIVDKADKKASIIKVEVKSSNEGFSKSFNEVLVNTVNDFYIRTKTKKSQDNIAILQHKTDSVRAVLNGSISTGAIAIDVTPNLNPTRQAQRTIPIQRSQFSVETNRAILGQLVQNLELSKMNLMKESPLIEKIDEPIFPLERNSTSKMKMAIIGCIVTVLLTALVLGIQRFMRRLFETQTT
ncbi:MAG: lipopolysaccharide biosynthesis protein [Sphingobacterium sp.]|jgi:hypothetical protein|nr:lipopolysaccharide biosynthesis protein [Sphingobacterium sp.]